MPDGDVSQDAGAVRSLKGGRIETALPRDPSCAAVARRLLERLFADRFDDTVVFDAKTVTSELVNNAYLHGTGEITLQLSEDARRLRIEVIDQGTGQALRVLEEAERQPVGGHGLSMVDTLSSRWGAHEGTTHVWAELALP